MFIVPIKPCQRRAALARLRTLLLFGILLLGILERNPALSAPIATPTPGTGTVLSATVPNPTQFNFSSGTVISSSQVNSNFYGVEVQIFALIAGLNGCSFIPSAAVASVVVSAPLTASVGTCSAGTGAGVALTIGAPSVATDYSNAGATFGLTEHIVRGTTTVSVASGQAGGSAAVALTGAAVFSSAASYQITASINITGGTYPPGWVAYGGLTVFCGSKTTSSFSVFVYNPSASTNVGSVVVDWTAVGT